MSAVTEIPVRRIDGSDTKLAEFDGKVVLVVNVASQCGLTPQYSGLQSIYEKYSEQGLVVLGFPANEFGAQEPGTNGEIAQFCETKFNVTFPMFEKIVVKGEGRHPLYDALVTAQPKAHQNPAGKLISKLTEMGMMAGRKDDDIHWNFEKFLLGKNGDVVARFAPDIAPDDATLIAAIEAELAKP